jgi:hypothetical protein
MNKYKSDDYKLGGVVNYYLKYDVGGVEIVDSDQLVERYSGRRMVNNLNAISLYFLYRR